MVFTLPELWNLLLLQQMSSMEKCFWLRQDIELGKAPELGPSPLDVFIEDVGH